MLGSLKIVTILEGEIYWLSTAQSPEHKCDCCAHQHSVTATMSAVICGACGLSADHDINTEQQLAPVRKLPQLLFDFLKVI